MYLTNYNYRKGGLSSKRDNEALFIENIKAPHL